MSIRQRLIRVAKVLENASIPILEKDKWHDLDNEYAYFHLTWKDLGPTVKLTPKVPMLPYEDEYGNVIEDNFTKRVSLAPTLRDCILAIEHDLRHVMYVYATNSKSGIVHPTSRQQSMIEWLTEIRENGSTEESKLAASALRDRRITPATLPPELSKYWYAIVPDAEDTHEVWSLKPITMTRIGQITF